MRRVFCYLTLAVAVWVGPAVAEPGVVIDDRLSLGVPISCITLDSTHFAERLLLVGTDTATDGRSFVIRVRTAPLAVIDTLATFRSHVKVVRAGYVNGDVDVDLLVGLDTTVVRVLKGAARAEDTLPIQVIVAIPHCAGPPDTILVAGTVNDIETDDSRHRFWVGYSAGVAYGTCDRSVYRTLGGMARFDSTNSSGTTVIADNAVRDIVRCSDGADTGQCLLAFWQYRYWWNMLFYPNEDLIGRTGVTQLNSQGEVIAIDTLVEVIVYDGSTGGAFAWVIPPVRLVDLTADGLPEFLYTYGSEWWSIGGDGNDAGFRVYTLGSDTALWASNIYTSASVWNVDGDGLPDVLLHKDDWTRVLQGVTGDSLSTVETQYKMYPEAIGRLEEAGDQRGVLMRLDTIVVFHFDFTTGVSDDPSVRPLAFELHHNYPNPFNASTTIRYSLAVPATATLMIHNVLGQRVRTLVNRVMAVGKHEVGWDGKDDAGHSVRSGVYFVVMKVGQEQQVRKMLLLR